MTDAIVSGLFAGLAIGFLAGWSLRAMMPRDEPEPEPVRYAGMDVPAQEGMYGITPYGELAPYWTTRADSGRAILQEVRDA